jgi:hypothetical protein
MVFLMLVLVGGYVGKVARAEMHGRANAHVGDMITDTSMDFWRINQLHLVYGVIFATAVFGTVALLILGLQWMFGFSWRITKKLLCCCLSTCQRQDDGSLLDGEDDSDEEEP